MVELTDFGKNSNSVELSKLDGCTIKISRSTSRVQQGATLSFRDINYEVEKRMRPCCGPKVRKHILKHINGIWRPGMNAILGSTGSGKTSLLDILTGRMDASGVSGQLLMNGHQIPQNFKCMVGYVLQVDNIMATLTVRENMMFSANLRLPSSYTLAERVDRVEDLIKELGLSDCANTRVGNAYTRGISGGEKKRANIGMELVMSPPLLFLDEPTTGLDSTTAHTVMVILRKLAQSGITIIFSIHQPRFSIFKLFDELTLLSKGDVVYQGPAKNTIGYFQELGYVCEEYINPADFFLDVVNGDLQIANTLSNGDHAEGIKADWKPKYVQGQGDLHTSLVHKYQTSSWNTIMLADLKGIYNDYDATTKAGTDMAVKRVNYNSSMLRQLWFISIRIVKNIRRSPKLLFLQGAVIVLFALITGGMFYQLDDESAIQNRRGALFLVTLHTIFRGQSALRTFINGRGLFIHENVSGYYRVSSYCLATLVCDIIPMRFVPCILYSCITYWMIGLRPEVGAFLTYTLIVFLTQMAGCGIAFAVGASIRDTTIGSLINMLIMLMMMIFGGLYIQIETIGAWISWLKWFSIARYAFEALSILELKDRSFCEYMNSSTPMVMCDGNTHLSSQGIAYASDWDIWSRGLALAGMTLICLLITYIQLLRMKKTK